jgi:hypothetical protein
MRELKYMGDIMSYVTDMETLNYIVGLVGASWRTLHRDQLSQDLQYRLSTTKADPRNDTEYEEIIRMVGLAM